MYGFTAKGKLVSFTFLTSNLACSVSYVIGLSIITGKTIFLKLLAQDQSEYG